MSYHGVLPLWHSIRDVADKQCLHSPSGKIYGWPLKSKVGVEPEEGWDGQVILLLVWQQLMPSGRFYFDGAQ